MFLANGKKATLIKYNRSDDGNYYDDTNKISKLIKVIPFKADDLIKFGLSSCSEATGFFQVRRTEDIRPGDQIIFKNHTYTIIKLSDAWLFGRVENLIVYVK